ncbi:MAG TPA: glycerophosphodiester phosphodiesterase [Methanolinea sp.]|nr:glycerophosphodiester phosphodiesterase [Methanolinea sp.]HQK54909.1 glycerophosphodiester phosphodiesterase [Methanolinea sp.]
MFIVGHRGTRVGGPENTCKAIRRGMVCADFVEVDVRLSRDRVPVIMHDPTLDRTTSVSGRVADLTANELAALDAGEGEHVPSLREICEEIRGKCGLFVEIKEPGSEIEVCRVLDREAPSPLMVVSFHRASLEMVSEILSGIQNGLIYSQPLPDVSAMAVRKHIRAILPRKDLLDRELVADAQRHGILVIPWTLNAEDQWEEARDLGVDGFVTDDPCNARRWRDGAI